MHGERRKWNKLTHAADVDGTDAAKACGGKPIRETLLERYGPWVDAAKSCVEIEGAQLGTAIEACPLVARER